MLFLLALAVLVILNIPVGGNVPWVMAQPGGACTNATLTGSYAYEIIGQDGTEAPFLPFAALRLVQLDGKGNLLGSGFRVLAGNTAQTKVTGTYQVENDCTVNFDIGVFKLDGTQVDQDTLFGAIVERGNKVRALITKTDIPGTNSVLFERVKG
jgi:hypothetical protein